MTVLARIADLVLNQPLLLTPEKAQVVLGVLAGRIGVDGPELSRFEGSSIVIDDQGRVKERPYKVTEQGVAIITITGSLVNRGAWVGAYSGLTSYEGIQFQLKTALAASEVRSVVLDIHSPGGEATGCFETAALVREVAAVKPVIAVVNGMACSGGYMIASGASEVVTTESGVSGSIGVVTLHVDASGQLDQVGLKPTLIIAGAHKADGHPFGPLPEDVKADFQARIDGIYTAFVDSVALGRGERMTADAVRATEARIFIGAEAVKLGLADRVGTFESVLQDLTRAKGRTTTSTKGMSMTTEANGASAATTTNAGITQEQLDAAISTATAADRVRMTALDELAAKCAGNADALKIIATAKTDGSSAEKTALALVNAGAFQKAAVLSSLQQDAVGATALKPAANDGTGGGKPATEVAATPDGWKAEWTGDANLQAEFPKVEHYVSFKTAEASGRVRIFEPGRRKAS